MRSSLIPRTTWRPAAGFLLLALALSLSSCVAVRTVKEPPITQPVTIRPASSSASTAPRPSAARRFMVHTVAPGETLWRIAKVYDVPEASISRSNRLDPGASLQLGQQLKIPDARDPQQVLSLFPSEKWKYIIIHHSATDEGSSLQFNTFHQSKGWDGVGYHFVIDNGGSGKADGFIEITPRWLKQTNGAHCKAGDMNTKSIGICLVGSFNESAPTSAQIKSLVYLVNTLRMYYKIPVRNIMGHGQVDGALTDCPGKKFPWTQFKRQLR